MSLAFSPIDQSKCNKLLYLLLFTHTHTHTHTQKASHIQVTETEFRDGEMESLVSDLLTIKPRIISSFKH